MSWESARSQLSNKINQLDSANFNAVALAVFNFQATYNPLYKTYLKLLKVDPEQVNNVEQIPFLPIQFFKTFKIQTGSWKEQEFFSSSGTTANTTSQHFIYDLEAYRKNTLRGFEDAYGKPVSEYCVLALLPAYLERKGSSLVEMANHFIQQSKYAQSGFFLYNYQELINVLRNAQQLGIPTLLLGVSFALWDLAEQFPLNLQNIIIMETGGMKGRRAEITRSQLHQIFQKAFQIKAIHSEYGMTEMLSQAYSKGHGLFYPSPTMSVLTREITDPLTIQKRGKTGAINIIDLANLDSISFIATDDIGKVFEDGSFEVLGRMDSSDIRGCNLLYEV